MNARTTITPEGNIPIPADVMARLGLTPGMDIEIDEHRREIRLKPKAEIFAPDLPRVTMEELLSRPRHVGKPKTTAEISRLSNKAIRKILADQERDASD